MAKPALGIRSFPNGFSCVILTGTQQDPRVVVAERYTVPKNAAWPDQLVWVRKQIAELCELHKPRRACIKAIEPSAMRKSRERFQVEAIIIEYLKSEKSIECQYRIKSQLKRDIVGFDEPARYLEKVIDGCEELGPLKHLNFQEACLAAISELPPHA
jgi:hypothetical protein